MQTATHRASHAAALTEPDLRVALRVHLGDKMADDACLVEELSIEGGAARVDVAVIGSRLEAFEIKSDRDSFARLHNQIHAYNRTFDRITLVTGPAFAAAALEVMPSWWGVLAGARGDDGVPVFQCLRAARDNPRQEARSLAMFLWREEAAAALENRAGRPVAQRRTRSELQAALAQMLEVDELRAYVTRCLRQRAAVPTT